jgi:hypothetical protein
MFQDHPIWVAHQRARWQRPDAHLFVRPDAHRFMPSDAPRLLGKDAVRYFWPDAPSDRPEPALDHKHQPRSLDELHELVSSPGKGYDIHHIVEQTPADQDGFPRRLINRDDNLVRIPTLKHWQINAWYQTRNPDFGNVSPRDYLRGKNWDERRRVGLDALIRFGVLRP